MNLIHRHIFMNVLLTCGAAVGLFAFVLLLGSALKDLLGHVLAGQLAPDTLIRLIGLSVPVVVSYALPMGTLSGVLLVLGRMSADREITALRASGLSVAWLSAPILFFALLGVALTLVINFDSMPRAKVAYERELADALQQHPLNFITPKTFIRDFHGVVLYVGEKKNDVLKDFWIWQLDSRNRVKGFARADTGRVTFDEKNNKLILTLEHAQSEIRDEKDPENFSEARATVAADEMPIELPLDKLTGGNTIHVKQKWLTFSQLMTEWRRLDRPDPAVPAAQRALQQMRVQVTIQEKFATAFSVLAFTLIAIPLGIKVSRKETSANLFLGLALVMAYYFGTIAVGWVDSQVALRPDLLMWLPNFTFQGLGFWMFYKVDRA